MEFSVLLWVSHTQASVRIAPGLVFGYMNELWRNGWMDQDIAWCRGLVLANVTLQWIWLENI